MRNILINNWAIVHGDVDPYQAPEAIPKYLTGDVVGHPRLGDMDGVRTSQIMSYDKENKVVVTKNNNYVLGEVHPNYEAEYPNALERVFKD
jgi:hypothetical protein